MNPATFPWWGWLIAAGVLWLLQMIFDAYEQQFLRVLAIIGMCVSALIGIIRFVKWVWIS
ncbi:MAG: hypothetical protein ABI682_08560 [Acidobacteriota bacterium]